MSSREFMSDEISQYERRGDNEIGWGAAMALSAVFHVGAFVFFVWILPLLMALLLVLLGSGEAPGEEKEEVVMVRLLEEAPSPPETSPKNFVREPLESPPPPEENILDEVLPPEEKAPPAPPPIAKTKAPPPKAVPPKVEKPKAEVPRPRPAGAESGGPQPIAGLGESAASRLLGQSLGRPSGQLLASSAGMRRDEELMRYVETVKSRIRNAWTPSGRAMAAKNPARYELRIEADGRISRIGMAQSSGNRDFDQSVERALKKASPFPPLPSVFEGQAATLDLSLSPEQMR